MKAASKSQGPNRWRREEHLGLAGEGSGVGWSGKVPGSIYVSFILHLFHINWNSYFGMFPLHLIIVEAEYL